MYAASGALASAAALLLARGDGTQEGEPKEDRVRGEGDGELAVAVDPPESVEATSATLRGRVEDLGGADSADVALEYRGSDDGSPNDWATTGEDALTSPGPFSGKAAGLDPNTEYEVRTVADAGDGKTSKSDRETFTTGGLPGGSSFEYTDGFADASWFHDDVDVYRIQNASVGELENALTANGPRVVLFETSGTIDLEQKRLTITDDECWIAGQTAPSPGITLVRGDLWIDADDCVVQHLRVRPGDAGNESDWEPDAIRTADGSANNIIDHCTGTWSVDENVSPGYDATATTISNCLIAEALNDASHSKGDHSMGMLVGDRSVDNAIVGNVFAHNKRRNPRLKADSESVVANNVFYHFESGTAMGSKGTAVVEGNGYLRPKDDYNVKGGAQNGEVPDVYLSGNYTEADNAMTNEQFNQLDTRPFWPSGLKPIPSSDVVDHNLAYAGARPADRTDDDVRVVEQVRNSAGTYVDSQEEVGGYPDLAENTRPLDVPESGLREWLKRWSLAVVEEDVTPPDGRT